MHVRNIKRETCSAHIALVRQLHGLQLASEHVKKITTQNDAGCSEEDLPDFPGVSQEIRQQHDPQQLSHIFLIVTSADSGHLTQ